MILQRKVLILNKDYTPINVCSVKRALILIFKNRVLIIDQQEKTENGETWTEYSNLMWEDWKALKPKENEECLSSSNSKIRIPEVIRLINYNKYPLSKVNFNKRAIFRRDQQQCQYCGCYLGAKSLTIDHILPKSRGGTLNWENATTSCNPCNTKKANRTPEEANMRFFHKDYKPIKPSFQIFRDFKIDSWEKFI